MARSRRLPRRTFLRGLGGVALALPALEIMTPRARGADATAPMRYVVAFAGTSLGRSDGTYFDSWDQTHDLFAPDEIGAGYQTKRATAPLTDLGLTDEVSIVSGLKIPWETNGVIPPAGRQVKFHESTMCPLICGVRGTHVDTATGPTSDQVVADAIAGDTPHRVVPVCVQAMRYRGGSGGDSGTLSYRMGNAGLEPVAPYVSPRLLFESLFTGFTPPGADPASAAAAAFELARRKSVLDIVKHDADRLRGLLGGIDKQRMERHFDELRALEQKLDMLDGLPSGGGCLLPTKPGDDPPIGSDYDPDSGTLENNAAWSDEETRAVVHTELLHMALACDLTRSVALQYTYAHCWLNLHPITGQPTDVHESGHTAQGFVDGVKPIEAMSDAIAWHVRHWGNLVRKLRDTTDFDGRRMLDNTAIVLVFEGGHGYDPESGTQDVHSSENMAALIAGRVGGLNPSGGKHIVMPGEHPTKVITSAMQAVGAGSTLGEVSGVIPGLFD